MSAGEGFASRSAGVAGLRPPQLGDLVAALDEALVGGGQVGRGVQDRSQVEEGAYWAGEGEVVEVADLVALQGQAVEADAGAGAGAAVGT